MHVFYCEVQDYYTWVATNPLCHWLRNVQLTSNTYVSAFGRRCTPVNPHGAPPVIRRVRLAPIHFHAKSMSRRRYWPNEGRSFPASFYHQPPPFTVLLHALVDVVVTPHGHVIGRAGVNGTNVKLTRYSCRAGADRSTTLPDWTAKSVIYGRVLVAGMISGMAYYHRLLEEIPRVAPYVDFLRRNPDVRIHVSDVDKLTVGMLRSLGIADAADRAVRGHLRAGIAYVPRFAECLWPRPVDVQLAARAFRRHIRHHLVPGVKRDRVVMVRRTGHHRRLNSRAQIEEIVQRAAADFGLRFSLFTDSPPPTLNNTMIMFHEAVLVVAPHGAGLANIVFSMPGTSVVEVTYNRTGNITILSSFPSQVTGDII